MPILLYVVGAITLVIGALTLGFGIPDKEFSFGNTLILAGATAIVGGLIVIALGVVVSQLRRLADAIGTRAPLRPVRPADVQEAGRAPAAGRIPFPSRPKSETPAVEAPPVEPLLATPLMAAMPREEPALMAEAPTLPNPDMAFAEPAEEGMPSPPSFAAGSFLGGRSEAAAPPVKPPADLNGSGAEEHAFEPPWLSAPHVPPPVETPRAPEEANFEAVWPAAEGRMAGRSMAGEAFPAAPAPEAEPEAITSERRTVAILKSGVVDGMAYTLYVDGSIEAELPQGTLRFASINDLREHLEKTS